MNETVKKYGVWVAAGAVALYLLYKQTRGGRSLVPSAAGGAPGDQYRLESERLRQAGAFDIQRLQLENNLELQRLKLANDRFNLEQQALARNRALDIARQGQTSGLINQLLKNLEAIMRGGKAGSTGSTGGGEGRTLPGTPNTFPGHPQLPPAYPVPAPNINPFDSYVPSWPTAPTDYPLSVTDWGEAPQFESAGTGLDTGASFYDQWGGSDFTYGYGFDTGESFSGYPSVGYGDYPGDIGLEDFTYGYGAGESYDDYSAGDIGAGDDFYYGYGADA